MKRYGYGVALAVLMLVVLGGVAMATPRVNGDVVTTRIFNDCPVSALNVVNDYPYEVTFDECNLICFGWANLHNWSFSSDRGVTQTVFNNTDCFEFDATVNLSGNDINGGEAGLRLSPWWSQQVDGRMNIRIPDGEIACFGGVLPFYSFTGTNGLHYLAGQDIRLMMVYRPYANTALNPATIEYKVLWGGTWYDSGELPFGNCTPGEEAHGCYGIMDDARAGGYSQNRLTNGDPNACVMTHFYDICYEVWTPPVAATRTTWGNVKASYR